MQWTPLARGRFTGIDWSDPEASAGLDPYLAWAEADDFRAFGLQALPDKLALALELHAGRSVRDLLDATSRAWLNVPEVYHGHAAPRGLRFCTAWVSRGFFRAWREGKALRGIVKRFELGMALGVSGRKAPPRAAVPVPGRERLRGKVLASIDDGAAFVHADFLRGRRARTRFYWRQDAVPHGCCPPELGYGDELRGAAIDAALREYSDGFTSLLDESAVYRHFRMGLALDQRVSHGTHVLDLAAGPRTLRSQIATPTAPPSWALAQDDASRADLVVVQLDRQTVADTSGGAMNLRILDGLMYILARCAPSARITVNISWGTLAGPHDGSALLEAAMDQLVALHGGRLQIVLPAGNGYQARTHASARVHPRGTPLSAAQRRRGDVDQAVLHWRVLPDDRTPSFLELWIEAGRQDLQIGVAPPGLRALPSLAMGESGMWLDAQGRPLCMLVYPRRVATGDNGTCAVLALAPTFSFSQAQQIAPCGSWTVTLTNGRTSAPASFDAYVERDDQILQMPTGARQSLLDDALYDTSGDPGSFVDHPRNLSLVRRSGTFNSIGTGRATTSVGGVRADVANDPGAADRWARYSPRRPDPDAQRHQRPGVVKMPDAEEPSDQDVALAGVCAAGTRSGARVRLAGTSSAAPQKARECLNA